MKYIFIILLFGGVLSCKKDTTTPPQSSTKPVQKTDTVYSYNCSWENITGNTGWASNYAYEGNFQSFTGNDIIENLICIWVRPAYSSQSWTKVPCKGYFTNNDSIVFYTSYGFFYRYGTAQVTPQDVDIKAFVNISN